MNGFSQVGDAKNATYYDLDRNTGRSGPRSSSSTFPSICTRAIRCAQDCRIYEGHEWLLGPTWAFGQETAVHALRLMGSGLFDRYPGLRIILGHMGEGLPYSMWRIDHRNGWVKTPPRYKAKKKICRIFQRALLSDDVGKLPHPDADRRHARDRRRPHPVLGRLAVRERRSRRAMVRQRHHQRGGPQEDRTRQRAQAVQARESIQRKPAGLLKPQNKRAGNKAQSPSGRN